MADVNANINIGINTNAAVANLKQLQAQISQFNQSVVASNATAAAAQRQLTSNLVAQIGATKAFSTSFQNVETSASRLGKAIDKNRLSLGEYFKYGIASSRTFGSVFRNEHNAVMDLATDRVKRLQTQYIALGQAQGGVQRALAVRPLQLWNAENAIAIQRQQIFNKLLHDGSTSLVNWGKNTQWAGRQLMVGFTVPLTIFGGYAASVFMDLDKQITQFRRVYGDAMTPSSETDMMVEQLGEVAREFTKYGIAASESMALAAKSAATGLQGADLIAATREALRLATLGQMDYQQALDATISLQSAFGISSEDLATNIDFLNAVENQTITSLDDITSAIPRVAPVIKGLGGDVRDLAVFLTAMREGGVNAAEGANALKSGLASLINPTKAADEMAKNFGINMKKLADQNKGDVMGLVMDFADAIKGLSKFDQQKLLARVFGKYQFARMGALFKNITKDGSQAARVIDLAGMSIGDLAALSEKDLGQLEQSISVRFTGAIERLKLAIAPIGETFLRVVTPIVEWVTGLVEKFQELGPEAKKWGLILIGGLGVVAPTVIMLIGLIGNFLGQGVKGFSLLNQAFQRLKNGGKSLTYIENEALDALAASASLEGQTNNLTSALNVQREAVEKLAAAYQSYLRGAAGIMDDLPQAVRPPEPPPTGTTAPTGPTPSPSGAGGARRMAYVPGGFHAAHFGAARAATPQEVQALLANPKLTQSARDAIASAQAAGKAVMLYSNEIVTVSDTLNQALTKGKATVGMIKKDLVTRGKYAHTELAYQMRELGATQEQIDAAVLQITERIKQSLTGMKNDVIMTEEEFAAIVQKAYLDVADAGDQLVAQAKAEMDRASRVLDPTARSGKGQRVDLGAGVNPSYSGRRDVYYTMMQEAAGPRGRVPYSLTSQFNIAPLVRDLDIGLDRAAEIWKGFSDEVKIKLAGMRDDFEKFSTTFVAEAGKMGIQVGKATQAGIEEGFNGQVVATDMASEMRAGAAAATGQAGAAGMVLGQAAQAGAMGGVVPTGAYSDITTRRTYDADGNEIPQTNKEVGKVKGAAQKFGKALVNGSAKLQGAMFAMDGVAFGLSMMDNQIGEFAGKMMPAMMGLQGLTMVLPMITNPAGAIAAALALTAGAFIGANMAMDNMRREAQNMIESMIASRKTIDAVGEFFGRQSLSEKRREKELQQQTGLKPEDLSKVEQFVQSDVGQSMFTGLQEAVNKFGSSVASKQFAANLSSMVLQGVLSPKEARAIAALMGEQLGSETFGIAVQGELKQIIGPDGKDIRKNPVRVAIEIDARNQNTVAAITDDMSELSMVMNEFGEWTEGDFGAMFIPVFGIINTINKMTLDWDNLIGDAARWARGVLNPDDFENVNMQLELMGGLVGNQLTQAYDNLAAAQERSLTLQERAEALRKEADKPKSTKKQRTAAYEAEADVRRAEKATDILKQSIVDQKEQLSSMFAQALDPEGAATDASNAIIRGINESVATIFEDNPLQKAIYESLDLIGMGATPEMDFKLRMEVASGALTPSALNTMLDVFAGNAQQTGQVYLDIVANMEGDSKAASAVVDSILMAGFEGADSDKLQRFLLLQVQTMGMEQATAFQRTMQWVAQVPDAELKKKLSIDAVGMTPDELKELNKSLRAYTGLSDESMQTEIEVSYNEDGIIGLRETTKAMKDWDKATKKERNTKSFRTTFLTENFGEMTPENKALWEEFQNKETTQQRRIEIIGELSRIEVPESEGGTGLSKDDPVELETTLATGTVKDSYALCLADWSTETAADPAKINTDVDMSSLAASYEKTKAYYAGRPIPLNFSTTLSASVNSQGTPYRTRYQGGMIRRLATGGEAGVVPGDGSRDTVPALLTPGEFVIRKATVDKYGPAFFQALNMSAYARGGMVGGRRGAMRFADGGEVPAWAAGYDEGIDTTGMTAKEIKDAKKQALDELKRALNEFIKGINEQAMLYGNMNTVLSDAIQTGKNVLSSVGRGGGLAGGLRGTGMSENIVQQILDMGPKEARAWFRRYTEGGQLTSQGLAQTNAMMANAANLQISENIGGARIAQSQVTAANALRGGGASDEVIKAIAGDPEAAQAYSALLANRDQFKEGSKKWKEANAAVERYERSVRKGVKAEEDLAEALDPVGAAIDKIDKAREATLKRFALLEAQFKQKFGEIERKYQPLIKASEKRIQGFEAEIQGIEDEIAVQEELNQKDEDSIRTLERSKELKQRELEVQEQLNQKDQERIESIRRQDELRNRTADALSHELEVMSRTEQKIRDSYQKRIEALDAVAKINDHIIAQQKNQISLATALTSGDIAAAAQAQQEMQAADAQYAQEQMRSGLEAGMNAAVAGLTTSGGLTRAQAEEQINAIKEQSYQSSLQIRDIEDAIYQRNLDMIPIKERIAKYDSDIRKYQDAIYDRESTILNIQRTRLEPKQKQLDAEQRTLSTLEQSLENEKAAVNIAGLTYEQLQNEMAAESEAYDLAVAQVRANEGNVAVIGQIVDQWNKVQKSIIEANQAAKDLNKTYKGINKNKLDAISSDLEAGTITKEEAKAQAKEANDAYAKKLAEIESTRQAAITAARNTGVQAMQNFATGGMVRYAVGGSVMGAGARDSVPAMLSPGEFVMRRAAVDKYGASMLNQMNTGAFNPNAKQFSMPTFKVGGMSAPASGAGMRVNARSNSNNNFNMPMYNAYSVSVNVPNTNADPDLIANKVMFKLAEIDRNKVRSLRGNK